MSNHKTSLWKGICIGAFFMLLLVVAFYFVDKYVLRDPVHILRTIEKETPSQGDTLLRIVENNHYYYDSKDKGQRMSTDSVVKDTVNIAPTEEEYFQEDEFFFDYQEVNDDDDIYRNQVLAIRKIHVATLSNETDSILKFNYFDVEQLSEAIKNKRTYLREGNALKVKGMDIQNIRIVCYHNEYYIERGGHYYPIPENQHFARIQEAVLKNN